MKKTCSGGSVIFNSGVSVVFLKSEGLIVWLAGVLVGLLDSQTPRVLASFRAALRRAGVVVDGLTDAAFVFIYLLFNLGKVQPLL